MISKICNLIESIELYKSQNESQHTIWGLNAQYRVAHISFSPDFLVICKGLHRENLFQQKGLPSTHQTSKWPYFSSKSLLK